MAEKARERRKRLRAIARAEVEEKAAADHTRGCVRCGRGEINTSLLPPPLDQVNAKLELVPCTDLLAHRRPSGRHIGRCSGWVYQHVNERLCAAVIAQGKRALATAGAN